MNKKIFRTLQIKIFYLFFIVQIIFGQNEKNPIESHSQAIGLASNLNATMGMAEGIMKDLGNLFPTSNEILDGFKQVIGGYSMEFLMNFVHIFCTSGLHAQSIKPPILPSVERVNINLLTLCEKDIFKINETERLLHHKLFDVSKKVVLLVIGWATSPNDSKIVDIMSKAYICRGEANFLVYDAGDFIDTQYFWAAFNSDKIGLLLSEFLVDLIKEIPIENIHLIGHSLGAHILSAAARYFTHKTNGTKFKHLTGLDPANPCFNEGETLTGLSLEDAEFIDVIHSNPGVFGKREAVGHVDFYTNGFAPLATGCFDNICAHDRSFEYYAETVYPGNEHNFLATRCNSLESLHRDACSGDKYAMGYAVEKNITGSYFLEVRGSSPYGMNGTEKREKINTNCGLCEKTKKES